MTQLSERQLAIQERETAILDAARAVLLERGYFGLTMEVVAKACGCPKGTMYQRFGCKEDLIVALALRSIEKRLTMMKSAARYDGLARERALALNESVFLFTRLYPDDSRIMHAATGPVREKATPLRIRQLMDVEHQQVAVLKGLLEAAVTEGSLVCHHEDMITEMTFGMWALVDGSFTLIESDSPRAALGIQNPFTHTFRTVNVLADAYGWLPLFADLNWTETLAKVRQTVFPEEAQAVYGQGNWYGEPI